MKKKVSWFIKNFEEVFCVIFMLVMIISLLMQVFFRYVIGKSLPWTEEISRYGFVFLVYFATVLSAKNKTHIRVTAQFKPLKAKLRRKVLLLSDCVWLVFNCVVVYKGFEVFVSMGKNKQISPVLGWDMKYIFLIVPIGFLLMTFRILQNYYQEYLESKEKGGTLNAD
ncbi:MAG: TRAP transporter small permease [Peptococcaceae bacterium]